jgi:inner membrane transporter RhtA
MPASSETTAARRAPLPPAALVLLAVSSVQFGAALAKTLFDDVGPAGTVLLRAVFAALVLAAIWRPRVSTRTRRALALASLFGVSLAGMNMAFYASLDRLPLGIAVTFEFVGPLGVAVFGSRRPRDLLWVALAGAGIVLLSDFGGADLDGLGVALALLAGAFWAAYILLAAAVGTEYEGPHGLALGMAVAALLLVPIGVAEGGADLLLPWVLAVGAGVAMLSSALPYALEMEALRRMPAGVFGVLMSLEPGMAALAGFLLLGEELVAREVVAILLVVVASAGATRGAGVTPHDA